MRVKHARRGSNAGGCEPPTSPDRRLGVISRRSAFLLSGTAAIALSIAQPASAITINDPAAAAVGGIDNYYDSTNQFPNTVSLFITKPKSRFLRLVLHWLSNQCAHGFDGGALRYGPIDYRSTIDIVRADRRA